MGLTAFAVRRLQVRELGVPLPRPEAPHSPGSRAGPGAAAPRGHALSTRASALFPRIRRLRLRAQDSTLRLGEEQQVLAARRPPPAPQY